VEVWGPDQEAYLARELTKMHEQAVRGPLSSLLATVTVHALKLAQLRTFTMNVVEV
jgi:16S rRNA C1402 (ribose-2'-O) methylase RsmI